NCEPISIIPASRSRRSRAKVTLRPVAAQAATAARGTKPKRAMKPSTSTSRALSRSVLLPPAISPAKTAPGSKRGHRRKKKAPARAPGLSGRAWLLSERERLGDQRVLGVLPRFGPALRYGFP